MKALRHNKLLGIAMGDRSVLIAEVLAGDKPSAKHLAEFEFPQGVTLENAAALGLALAEFLEREHFSARHAVIGLPAKWLLVKNKDLPPADAATAADLLRLGAETEFSSELKDLVFDYVGQADPSQGQTVLLIATPRRHLEWATSMCDAARLTPEAVTSSAAVLAMLTQGDSAKNTIVLTIAAGGAEFVSHRGAHANMLRHLRAPEPSALFINELRRAVSAVPTNGSTAGSEMVVWDGAGLEAGRFEQMGLPVRYGDLPSLGVIAPDGNRNGAGRKYGRRRSPWRRRRWSEATSRLISCIPGSLLPPVRRVQSWMVLTGLAVVLAIVAVVGAYLDIQHLTSEKAALDSKLTDEGPRIKTAQDFVSKVTFAEHWEAGDPRYVACLRDITELLPVDGQTYVTGLSIHEIEQKIDPYAKQTSVPASPERNLAVTINGKAPNQERALQLRDSFLQHRDWFEDVKLPKVITSAGTRFSAPEASFTITCTFKATPLKN